MAQNFNAELPQKLLGESPDRHPRRRLASAGPFQDVARVRKVVFDRAGEIGMSGTGSSHGLPERRIAAFDRQVFGPVLPIGVADDDRDRRADRLRMANAGHDLRAIGLDLHAAAAAEALLAPPKLVIDRFDGDWNSCRKTRQRCHQTLAVGLARGFEA